MKQNIDARTRLAALIAKRGTQRAAAEDLGVTKQMVSDLVRGRRNFSDAMLAKLGLKRTTAIVDAGSRVA